MNLPPANRLYWGELHNHNELGYAQGTLERSYDIARSHLDFYAFTPHGMFADRPDTMLLDGSIRAYPVVEQNWDKIQQAAARNNTPGKFTCFLGYEWHSSAWGHGRGLAREFLGRLVHTGASIQPDPIPHLPAQQLVHRTPLHLTPQIAQRDLHPAERHARSSTALLHHL